MILHPLGRLGFAIAGRQRGGLLNMRSTIVNKRVKGFVSHGHKISLSAGRPGVSAFSEALEAARSSESGCTASVEPHRAGSALDASSQLLQA